MSILMFQDYKEGIDATLEAYQQSLLSQKAPHEDLDMTTYVP